MDSVADFASSSVDLGCFEGRAEVNDAEGYVDALVRASLKLVKKGLPLVVRRHGVTMLQHLLSFRKEELSSKAFADLRKVHVQFLNDLVLKSATTASDDPVHSMSYRAKNNKHRQSQLVLATNSLTDLAARETDTVIGEVTGGARGFCAESNISSSLCSRSCDGSTSVSNEIYCSSSTRLMDVRDMGDMGNATNNACNVSEFPDPTMLVNCDMMSRHQGKGFLLLAEHNIICEAFLIVIASYSGLHENIEMLQCLLVPINKIWTLQEWKSKYLHHGSGLTCLFSDSQFVRNAYCMVRFCEEKLQSSRKDSSASKSYQLYIVNLLQMFLPLLILKKTKKALMNFPRLFGWMDEGGWEMAIHLFEVFGLKDIWTGSSNFEAYSSSVRWIDPVLSFWLDDDVHLVMLLQSIHALWDPTIACNLSEELERAKYPEPSFPFECATNLHYIKDPKGSNVKETRTLIEGIRESAYNVIGLCASIEGAFYKLFNGLNVVGVAMRKYFGTMEFRHLIKFIQLTIIPLVKDCPRMFWKEWTDNLLQPLLSHCEKILHSAWFRLLYHGRAGVPYYFGKLSGLEGKIETLERDILLKFTREVCGLLEILALTDHNKVIFQEDVNNDNDIIYFQDVDSMASTSSLFRYLVINDCFGMLRMGLFGYFVDDETTAKAIPFCRALVCFALASEHTRLRTFILDNLLPCVIKRLDNQLPCAVQRLKYKWNSNGSHNARRNKLNSNASNETSRDLVLLCQELYSYMLSCCHVQTQALALVDKKGDNDEKNSFEVWLERQKENLRVKACSAAKELPTGYLWNWEFQDEFQRYLYVYIDMLREVDAVDQCAENVYMDKESLFQKLSSEFRSKYSIHSWVHPYMWTISSIRQRKLCSLAAVTRNRKISDFLRILVKLKPYVEVSDCSIDVIYRFKQTFEIPDELNKYVAPSVELLHSILLFWEPRFHPLIREAHMDKLLGLIDRLTRSECIKPVMPIIKDFPLHLQPYATAFVETKLKESKREGFLTGEMRELVVNHLHSWGSYNSLDYVYHKYYIAKEQVSLHEEFDQYLASGVLDDYMVQFMSSQVQLLQVEDFVDELFVTKMLPSQFWVLERDLIKLSFERRAEIVRVKTELCTYVECLQCLFENEELNPRVESLVVELEAEGFFNVGSNQNNWGKITFSKLIDKFSNEFLPRHTLPVHYAIRGLIDCRTILLQRVNWRESVKKVAVDVRNELDRYLPKFWKDRFYEHPYYAIIRDPTQQVILGNV